MGFLIRHRFRIPGIDGLPITTLQRLRQAGYSTATKLRTVSDADLIRTGLNKEDVAAIRRALLVAQSDRD